MISEREAMLVPSENTGEMANAIRQLLDDNERSQRLAENASRRLRSAFAFEPWLDAYESLYRGLMARATVAQAVAK